MTNGGDRRVGLRLAAALAALLALMGGGASAQDVLRVGNPSSEAFSFFPIQIGIVRPDLASCKTTKLPLCWS